MDDINFVLTDFRRNNIQFINQIIHVYNKLSDSDYRVVEENYNEKYGNISLKPDDISDLKLVEVAELRNYYTQPPFYNLNQFYAYDFNDEKIYFKKRLNGPIYDKVDYPVMVYQSDDDNTPVESALTAGCSSCVNGTCDISGCGSHVDVSKDNNYSSQRFVYSGEYKGVDVTIEWIDPEFGDIVNEMSVWGGLEDWKVDVGNVYLDWSFWAKPVIVREQLDPINEDLLTTAKIKDIIIDLLNTLQQLHHHAILNNLSVENVGISKDGVARFINYSSMTDTKLYYGYHRQFWNSLWSSQVRETDQTTTIWNDLVELGYLFNYLDMKSTYGDQFPDLKLHVKEVDESSNPLVYKYMTTIKKHCPRGILDLKNSIYDTLRDIVMSM